MGKGYHFLGHLEIPLSKGDIVPKAPLIPDLIEIFQEATLKKSTDRATT